MTKHYLSPTIIIALTIVLSIASGLGSSFWLIHHLNIVPTSSSGSTIPSRRTTTIKEQVASNAIIDVAEQYRDSVVSVVASKDVAYVLNDPYNFFFNDPFGLDPFGDFNSPQMTKPEIKKEKQQVGAGTGFIITKEGLILTNKHVVADTEAEYQVTFANNDRYKATVVTRDPADDIAILKISDASFKEFKPVGFVANQETVKVGQMVVAIGNALGQFQNTVTTGVVSAKGREIIAGDGQGQSSTLNKLLQTDAAINPGNSGGPLVSLQGEVIGINTAIAGGAQGIGFAIPIDQTRITNILKQLQEHGKIVRPYLGLRYQIITPAMNQELKLGSDRGAWVKADQDLPAVLADSPASKAGIKGGDIILSVNGQPVDQDHELNTLINNANVGDQITLTILRDGQEQTLTVTLEERKE